IQILVENAIKHAFKNRKANNHITVTASQHDDAIQLTVTDNGQGIPKERIPLLGQISVNSETGTGSGLENLNRRLIGLYGPTSQLSITSTNKGTRVSCMIPYHEQKEDI
ncbi:MAG: ATP-binding protein, partial [Staphylococcus lugdunensis]|nr:ATP-binding protein [Staphylococcus lugdunensis]